MKYFAPFLTNNPSDFQAETGLVSIPGRFQSAILQIEFSQTVENSQGRAFTEDGSTPFAWLESRGVEVWGYVDVPRPRSLAQLGTSAEAHVSNPYWFRREAAAAIEAHGWYMDGEQYPPDMRNRDYLEWMLDAIVKTGVRNIYLDDYDPHRSFHCPEIATDYHWLAAQLRAAGCRLVANGGWQMDDPDASIWRYLLLDVLDGCLFEHRTGLSRWGGGWREMSPTQTAQLMDDWTRAGRMFWYDAWYNTDGSQKSRYASFEEHARAHHEMAEEHGAWFATRWWTQQSQGLGRSWWFDWYTPDVVTPPGPVAVDDLREAMARLEAALMSLNSMMVHGFGSINGRVDALRDQMEAWSVYLRSLP